MVLGLIADHAFFAFLVDHGLHFLLLGYILRKVFETTEGNLSSIENSFDDGLLDREINLIEVLFRGIPLHQQLDGLLSFLILGVFHQRTSL